MEITWQIWLKVLFGVSITGSAAVVCILFVYFFIKCKALKNNSKQELDEVIVIHNKRQEESDKDQNGNQIGTKINEDNGIGGADNISIRNVNDPKTNNKSLLSPSSSGIERNFHKDWYHSCPDFGRSTITHSENGYIIIAQSRPIVIDGSNVALVYGKGTFSAKGLNIVHNYFTSRGWTNKEITIFVKSPSNMSTVDQNICKDLEIMGVLHWTPSIKKSRPISVTSEEDYKILEYAKNKGGIIVTKNQFHDWYDCCPEFREVISKRLLRYTFVNDDILFHTGPINRDGKTLEEFLTF